MAPSSGRKLIQKSEAGCVTSHPALAVASPQSTAFAGGPAGRYALRHTRTWPATVLVVGPLYPGLIARVRTGLPRTNLRFRGTTTNHAAVTSSGSPRTPLGSRLTRLGCHQLRGKRDSKSASLGAGCFLMQGLGPIGPVQSAGVLPNRIIPRAEALSCTLVQTYHDSASRANWIVETFVRRLSQVPDTLKECDVLKSSFRHPRGGHSVRHRAGELVERRTGNEVRAVRAGLRGEAVGERALEGSHALVVVERARR